MKVAYSIGFPQIKGQGGLSCRGEYVEQRWTAMGTPKSRPALCSFLERLTILEMFSGRQFLR